MRKEFVDSHWPSNNNRGNCFEIDLHANSDMLHRKLRNIEENHKYTEFN